MIPPTVLPSARWTSAIPRLLSLLSRARPLHRGSRTAAVGQLGREQSMLPFFFISVHVVITGKRRSKTAETSLRSPRGQRGGVVLARIVDAPTSTCNPSMRLAASALQGGPIRPGSGRIVGVYG